MAFEDFVAFFEAQGYAERDTLALAILALEAEGGETEITGGLIW